MKLFHDTISVDLSTGPDIADITGDLREVVQRSTITQGMISLCCIGSTGSITTIEYEPGVVEDLKEAVNRLAPPGAHYRHEMAWHDGNGHSHVQAALLGPSISLSLVDGRLSLGTWQQVVVINHDNKPRRRKVAVTIVGT